MTTLKTLALFGIALLACDRPTSQTRSIASAPATDSAAVAPSTASVVPSAAISAPGSTSASGSTRNSPARGGLITFDGDPVGGPSPLFEPIVGDWYVAEEFGARGLKVDGSKWRNGTPSANLADQAKRLYGDRYAEFLDGVKAFAFFPFAVWKSDPPAGDIRVSVRFYPMAGRVDQAAGIAFAIAPDGSYLGARVNALEDNLLYFRVVKGKRSIIETIRDVPTPSKTWHTFAIELRGKKFIAELDGQKRFEKTLDSVPVGRLGLWSKADSQVLFDDFSVRSLAGGTTP